MISKEMREARYQEYCQDPYKVEKYDKPGIYCIKINDIIVYVGLSRNMLQRLADHSLEIEDGRNHKTNKYRVLYQATQHEDCQISFDCLLEVVGETQEQIDKELKQQEAIFINSLKPPLNHQLPKVGDPEHRNTNHKAKYITLEEIIYPEKDLFIF